MHKNDIQELDLPIQEAELIQAIKELKSGKSPGLDGLTAQYYKLFVEILKTPLLANLNSLHTHPKIPESFLQAHITVIPKAKKDPKECVSYRPNFIAQREYKTSSKNVSNLF